MKPSDLSHMIAGYLRGLMGAPLALDDVGLSREELIAKYTRHVSGETAPPAEEAVVAP
jgi:hypothetical protein